MLQENFPFVDHFNTQSVRLNSNTTYCIAEYAYRIPNTECYFIGM